MENFKVYNDKMRSFKNEEINKENHLKNIEARLKFLNLLIMENYWPNNEIDPVIYLHSVLCHETSKSIDKQQFYAWLSKYCDNDLFGKINKEAILSLFINKILTNEENCRYLTINGFNVFLKVFLFTNETKGKLSYSNVLYML